MLFTHLWQTATANAACRVCAYCKQCKSFRVRLDHLPSMMTARALCCVRACVPTCAACYMWRGQSRGADPSLLTLDTDPYLSPGRKSVIDVAVEDERVRQALVDLNNKYASECTAQWRPRHSMETAAACSACRRSIQEQQSLPVTRASHCKALIYSVHTLLECVCPSVSLAFLASNLHFSACCVLPLSLLLLLLLPGVFKAAVPHPDVGDWWALYDYGLDELASWPADYQHPYPGMQAVRH